MSSVARRCGFSRYARGGQRSGRGDGFGPVAVLLATDSAEAADDFSATLGASLRASRAKASSAGLGASPRANAGGVSGEASEGKVKVFALEFDRAAVGGVPEVVHGVAIPPLFIEHRNAQLQTAARGMPHQQPPPKGGVASRQAVGVVDSAATVGSEPKAAEGGVFDRALAFASLIGELELLAGADAFVGTPASSVASRLCLYLISGRKGRIPPYSLLDAPLSCTLDGETKDCVADRAPWLKRAFAVTKGGGVAPLMGSAMFRKVCTDCSLNLTSHLPIYQ